MLWLFGNEARGVPADLAALADARVRIPMRGRAESLNLAAAAAICLYTTQLAQGWHQAGRLRSGRARRRVARVGDHNCAAARAAASDQAGAAPEAFEGPPMSPTSRRKATSPADASRSLDR